MDVVGIPDHVRRVYGDDVLLYEDVLRWPHKGPFRMLLAARCLKERHERHRNERSWER